MTLRAIPVVAFALSALPAFAARQREVASRSGTGVVYTKARDACREESDRPPPGLVDPRHLPHNAPVELT